MNSNIPIEIEIKNELVNRNTNKHISKPQHNSLITNNINNNRLQNPMNYDNNNRVHINSNYSNCTAFKTTNQVQNLSPIKPSFVNIKDDNTAQNFTHSTPNNQFQPDSPTPPMLQNRPRAANGKVLPLIVNTIIEETTFRTEHTIKKEKIVKELAVNILELNDYKSRTEQLDKELKHCGIKLKNNQPDTWIANKSESIQNELSKLKSEMMQKIEDIHDLELELVKLEGNNNNNNNRQEISNLAYRNEEVINEIRKILRENNYETKNSNLTVNKVLDDYSKTRLINNNDYLALKDGLQQRFDFLKTQIEQEYSFLRNRLRQLDEKCAKMKQIDMNSLNNEMECIKTLMRTSKEKYEREKNFLFKDLNSNEAISQHFNSQKNHLERVLSERQSELQSLMRNFYSKLPYNTNNLNETTASFVITNNRSEISCNLTTNNSSFLTEEEEAIKKISDKIRCLKSKIDKKKHRKSITTVTEETNSSNDFFNNSNQDDDEEEYDETELINLNEQIRLLKSKMKMKGDELSRCNNNNNTKRSETCISFQDDPNSYDYNIRMSGNNNSNYEMEQEQIYLPIGNTDYMGTYRIEPIEICNQETAIVHPNEKKTSKKVIIIDKNKPIAKKYRSTIEIHAEHLQQLKQQQQQNTGDKTRCRSLSSARSSSSSLVTVSSHHQYRRNKQQNSIAISSTSKRRHQSAVYIKHTPPQAPHTTSNLVSVNLKSYKQPEQQDQLARNLEKSQKEIENLKSLLTERNELIEKQKLEHDTQQKEMIKLNDAKQNDLKNNDHLLKQLEEQKDVILNLKTKLTKLSSEGQLDTDQMSSISNSLNKVRQNVKQNFKNLDDNKSTRRKSVDASVQASDSAQNKTISQDVTETSSLVCNIPEHHRLEDLVHEKGEYINKLKAQLKTDNHLDEMVLLEKKAEFEALDLAINTRKQQLYNLELTKNRKLSEHQDEPSYSINDQNLSELKEEIDCLEQTLRKRTKELDHIEMQMKQGRKELNQIADSKHKAEKELDSLLRKNNMINKEISMFDKKAEEATINLIVAQEELDWAKDLKKTIEYDVEKIKSELVNYLRRLKANNFDQTKTQISSDLYLTEMEQKKLISEQKYTLEQLASEIGEKKSEINSIKEQSQLYVKQFKSEIEKNENYLSSIKKKHEQLQNECSDMKQLLDELNTDTKLKQQSLSDKNVLIETLELSIKKFKTINEEESKKLDDLERKLNERYNEFENADKQFKKLVENVNLLQSDENDLLNNLDKLNNDIRIEREAYDKLKQINDDLSHTKQDLESKLNSLTDAFDKLNEDFNDKDQQLNKFTILLKEKQLTLKREEEQLADLEYEKENLNQETNMLKDKFNRKKIEYDRLELSNKQLNEKFNQNETEATNYSQKIFEAKQQYDKIVQAIKEADFKLKDLNLKNQNKQQYLEQINSQILEKKEELTGLDTFLDELRRDTHQEKKELNSIKTEIGKQKRAYDELKNKSKGYAKYIESSESGLQRIQELTDELNEKNKYIRDLETNLTEKNKEFNLLNQSFLKSQEETRIFKNHLSELDEASKRDRLIECDLKRFLSNIEKEDEISRQSMCFQKQRSSVSSLLMQPLLRKAYSGNLINDTTAQSKLITTDLLNEKTTCILDEQHKYKENLIEKFQEKLHNLDRSKCQTKSVIDNLKTNLNEIEAMTANSIFKLTGMKNL